MENTVVIRNPPIFLNEKYMKKYALKKEFQEGEVNILYKDKIPREVLVTFKSKDLCDKYIQKFNNKFFQSVYDISLIIEPFTGTKEQEASLIDSKYPSGTEIVYPRKYEKMVHDEYERSYYESGLIFLNEDEISQIAKGVKWLFKKMGNNVLQGIPLLNTSLPVFLSDARTLHEVFAYEHKLAPYFLSKAAHSKDDYERLKWCIVYIISTVHISTINIKPFNPIIGETFQCKIGDMNLYLEQTVNHPNTFNFYAFNDGHDYKLYGHEITNASTGANSIYANKKGKYEILFKNGDKYGFYLPGLEINGIISGKRTANYVDKCVVVDYKNKRCGFIQFNPDKVGFLKGMFSKKQSSFPDTIIGNAVKLSDVTISEKDNEHKVSGNATKFFKIEGEWTNYICFDGDQYWGVDDYEYLNVYKVGYTCPSDGRNRIDLIAFKQGNIDDAQAKKESLEVLQRNDRKLRKDYAKK